MLCIVNRDVHETFQTETETRPETQSSETETRPRPRRSSSRDLDRDMWWKKINHHKINWTSKHFVFVMLWDFAARALYVHCAVLLQYVRQSVVRL